MSIQTIDHSPQDVLHRLDIMLDELLALRRIVQKMVQSEQKEDFVSSLAGSLGPANEDEMAYFNQFDVTWQRFADEPTNS
ncbi:MAG: hypothetical protein AAF702_30540 [Chloroflexota bacterium]